MKLCADVNKTGPGYRTSVQEQKDKFSLFVSLVTKILCTLILRTL